MNESDRVEQVRLSSGAGEPVSPKGIHSMPGNKPV